MNRYWVIAWAALFVGCEGPALPHQPPKAEATIAEDAKPAATVADSAQPSATQAVEASRPPKTSIQFTHPITADELKDVFVKAFEAGDTEALDKLFYWGDSTPDQRKLTRRLYDRAGVSKVVQAEIETMPDSEPGAFEDYTIKSRQQLVVEHESPTSSITESWPFGEVDGKYYLGAWFLEED
jgi:hypothetical protein